MDDITFVRAIGGWCRRVFPDRPGALHISSRVGKRIFWKMPCSGTVLAWRCQMDARCEPGPQGSPTPF